MSPDFSHLLSPGKIGHLELRNRIIMSPMGTYLGGRDGTVTERMKKYYEARARGGASLIIPGVAAVDFPRGKVMSRQIGISDDKFLPGLSELAASVHAHGAKIALQLQHGGRIAAPFFNNGVESVAPSVIPLVPSKLGMTHELTKDEIKQLVISFASAAGRAQKADIDGVEIHAGHGYLVNEFLSLSSNHRQDEYGGDLQNRARFLLEIIRAVRETVGPNYPVWCRIDGKEYGIEKGITEEEARETALLLSEAGIDALNVSGYGGSEGPGFTVAPLVYRPGELVPLARRIKKLVKIPVITAGRIDPEMGEKIVKEGDADFIGIGRQLIADPDLPEKLVQGRFQDIRKCIYCYTCVHQIFVRSNICCAVNPLAGKESEIAQKPTEAPKKVLVVGGGPAGLEAAVTAASRGHRVTLQESEKYLGGSVYFASILRRENRDLINHLSNQSRKSGVKVVTGSSFRKETLSDTRPDVLIMATGAMHAGLNIPGANGPGVIDGFALRRLLAGQLSPDTTGGLSRSQQTLLTIARNLFPFLMSPDKIRVLSKLWMPAGKRVAVLGGGLVGFELALFLAERGRSVTIVESSDQLATEMALPMKWLIEQKLEEFNTQILIQSSCERIRKGEIEVRTKESLKTIKVDTVIVATGLEPDNDLKKEQFPVPEMLAVGDCAKISYIKDSIADGFKAGSSI